MIFVQKKLKKISLLDDNEFIHVWMQNKDKLRSCCYHWLNGNIDLVEDAMSITSERAFNHFQNIKNPIRNYFSWLCKLSYNICIDLFRSYSRQNKLVNKVYYNSEDLFFARNISENLEDTLIKEEEISCLTKELQTIPKKLKQVIEYRFLSDLDYCEIADIFNTTKGNIRKKNQLGRARLQDILAPFSACR